MTSWAAASLFGLLCAAPSAGAQTRALTLHDAVAAAWERLPQIRSIIAREATAAAKNQSGSALFPNAPTATGNFVNDRLVGSNYGYVTSQVELTTPVWLPGEGTAMHKAASAEAQAASADRDALKLAVAEKILKLVQQAANASNQVAVATRRLAAAQTLGKAVRQRASLGESPETDALAADAETANAEMSVVTARAEAQSALAAYGALTGLQQVPRLVGAPHAGTPNGNACPLPAGRATPGSPSLEDQAILESNPRIVAARRAVELAEAKARLVRIENRDNPEIGLQGINEKQPGTRWDTRMAVIFRLPFATEARNAPRRAAAEQAVTEAGVELELARREALSALCQSDFMVDAAERSQEAAARAAASLDLRRGKIERAWRAGEMPLVEVVRANSMAFEADLARDNAVIDLAASRLNTQLLRGMVP